MSKCPCGGAVMVDRYPGRDRPRDNAEYCTACNFSWGVKYE